MTDTEKLLRDIKTLRESIQVDWTDLESNPLREEERSTIRLHLELCQTELKNLLDQLLGTEAEKLLRDIKTLRGSIQVDWADLESNPLREEERKNVRLHLELCQAEIENLLERLLALDDENSS